MGHTLEANGTLGPNTRANAFYLAPALAKSLACLTLTVPGVPARWNLALDSAITSSGAIALPGPQDSVADSLWAYNREFPVSIIRAPGDFVGLNSFLVDHELRVPG